MYIFLYVRVCVCISGGKIPAQCVHAALGVVRLCSEETIEAWEDQGEACICLKIDGEEEMVRILLF